MIVGFKRSVALPLLLILAGVSLASHNTGATRVAGPPQKAAPAPADDATIAASVKDKLSKTASLKDANINVDCKGGVVTLTGSVKTAGQRCLEHVCFESGGRDDLAEPHQPPIASAPALARMFRKVSPRGMCQRR